MPQPFFTIKATNIKDVQGRFASMRDKGAVEHSRNLVRDIGKILVDELKNEAPIGEHYKVTFAKGSKPSVQKVQPAERLKDAFFYRTYVRGKSVQLGVYVKPKQRDKLRWVVRGTHPFSRGWRLIVPKTKKALAFYWAREKKSMVLPYVKHPGTRPNPFHERALEKARPEIDKKERQAARLIAEDLMWKGPSRGGWR